ncbi:MAG: sulfatase-like hydrolase/transferase [Planctomycetes bacterium]|nr:sulfatase-like hydrolase/transferase [Planctomycetota bacterium]
MRSGERRRICFRVFVPVLLFVLVAVQPIGRCCDAADAPAVQTRPNIVVVLADDLGYGDLACYGHKIIKTPHLDRFALQGLRLTSCYSAAANCSPARAGLMTGRTPYRVGIHNWIPFLSPMHLRKSEITIATLLRKAGYSTCHVGKWHLNGRFNLPGQPQPSDHGFDYWFSTQNNALPTHHFPNNFVRNGKVVKQHRRWQTQGTGNRPRRAKPARHPANGNPAEEYAAHLVVDEAEYWFRTKRDQSKPFFLFVCFHEPHEPIASGDAYMKLYPGFKHPTHAAHHGNVTQMDAAFGRLMRMLEKNGHSKDTLVIFTSDNGPAITRRHPHGSAGPLRDKKGSVYEGGIRIPGIIRWPGRTKAGAVSDEPVSGVDLLPTLCKVAGIPQPADRKIDGTSWLPILKGKRIRRTTPLYWQFNVARGKPKVAMRIGDWKILATLTGPTAKPYGDIRSEDQRGIKSAELKSFELYNLKQDIGETTDLAGKEPQRLAAMTRQLRRMYRDVRNESPTWPAWKWPRVEGERIRDFNKAEADFLKKRKPQKR